LFVELVTIVVVVVVAIMMRLQHHNSLVVVPIPIVVVIAVGLDDNRILGACRHNRQNEPDRSESGNRQRNLAH
jgi:hypothetical protein